jgi:ABC-type protease/lipase transport system fused ATPase/permease subunit
MRTQAKVDTKSELGAALGSCKGALIGIGAFSGLINLLMLTSSLYMLEVYDRVLPSRSVPTLLGLSILAAILLIFQALLEITRGRLLVRIGSRLDSRLSPRVYDAVVRMRSKAGSDGQQPVRDVDTIRGFLSSTGPCALFDLPRGSPVPRHLLCVPPSDRRHGAGRRDRAHGPDPPERIALPPSDQGRDRTCGRAQPFCGGE